MSCNCFNTKKAPDSTLGLKDRIEKSKCTCSSRFTVQENRRTFSINKNVCEVDLEKIKVDGFLINSTAIKKCDYLYIYNKSNTYIFVELKGSDIKHALDQLKSVIEYFYNEKVINTNTTIRGAVAFSTYPGNNSTYRTAKARLMNNLSKKFKNINIVEKSKKVNYDLIADKFS